MHEKNTNLLFQIAVSMAAILVADGQTPKKAPVLDAEHLVALSKVPLFGSWNTSQKGPPLLAESLSPAYAAKLPDCDRVEVFLLAGDVKKPESAADRFPVRPYCGSSGVLQKKELKGAEAAKLCSLWRGLTFDNRMQVLSHSAAYGLRFHHTGKLVLETSVSFSCGNFSYPRTAFPMMPGEYSWHGFRTGDDAGKALASFLKANLPGKAAGE